MIRRFLSNPDVPYLSRPAAGQELLNSIFFAITLAAIEPGVVSVYVKQSFDDVATPALLAFAVAFVGASSELANLLSFIWTPLNQGKPKVRFVNALQAGVIAGVLAIALLPVSVAGLWVLMAVMLCARVCWSGIITVRPTIWRANYPRHVRAGVVGRFGLMEVTFIAIFSLALGAVLDHAPQLHTPLVLLTAVSGVGAIYSLMRLRVRNERQVLIEESSRSIMKPWHGPACVLRTLRKDPDYARFMWCLFLLGFGNLMIPSISVLILKDEFQLSYLPSILAMTVIPRVVQACAIPLWAKFLDRAHVVRFRSIHSWTFVIAGIAFVIGAHWHSVTTIFIATALMGLGFGGGALAWNLGHTDFAPVSETSEYMAAHLTLNGLRGIIAPFVSVGLFELLRNHGYDAGTIVYALALLFSVLGAWGFVDLRRRMGARVAVAIKR
ncbi:MAG: MFS transporter [Phycisphaerales bacterium]